MSDIVRFPPLRVKPTLTYHVMYATGLLEMPANSEFLPRSFCKHHRTSNASPTAAHWGESVVRVLGHLIASSDNTSASSSP